MDFTEETGEEDVEDALTAGPEEVEEGLSEQVEEEVALHQTMGNKLKWFSIRIFLKVVCYDTRILECLITSVSLYFKLVLCCL